MIVLGLCAGGVVTVRTVANTVLRLRESSTKRAQGSQALLTEDRMQRLETAVEAIAIEVERISEGQRFTTKLLSENSTVGSPPRA